MIGCLCLLAIVIGTGAILVLVVLAMAGMAVVWLVSEIVSLISEGIFRLCKLWNRKMS